MGRYGCCVFVDVIERFSFLSLQERKKWYGGKKEGKRVDEVVRWGLKRQN